jgi:Flp pilus assembly protein TadG
MRPHFSFFSVRRASRRSRRERSRGAEVIEFALVFLPMLSMICVLMCSAWAIFVKSTLQRAVSVGVRTGVTLTATDMSNGACLTETVKSVVRQNAMGMLSDTSKIKVHYYEPPSSDSSAAPVDVSTQASGNAPRNIMEVSIENYELLALIPRIFVGSGVDNAAMNLTVASADVIEPSRSSPCIGVAP